MGDRSTIGWVNPSGLAPGHTWNPWQGCTKISPGCRRCYMFTEKLRYGQNPAVVVRSKDPTFYAPRKWKEPALVFTCSWSDFFHRSADPWRAEAWKLIRETPHLTYLILTKRTHDVARALPGDWHGGYPNVWLGFSAENQECFDRRLAEIAYVYTTKLFVSLEPLLGPVVLPFRCVDWVIVGGESGPDFRAPDPAWVRSIRDQCALRSRSTPWFSRRIPFFFKQWGGLTHDANGRELDGREWNQWPPIRGRVMPTRDHWPTL